MNISNIFKANNFSHINISFSAKKSDKSFATENKSQPDLNDVENEENDIFVSKEEFDKLLNKIIINSTKKVNNKNKKDW